MPPERWSLSPDTLDFFRTWPMLDPSFATCENAVQVRELPYSCPLEQYSVVYCVNEHLFSWLEGQGFGDISWYRGPEAVPYLLQLHCSRHWLYTRHWIYLSIAQARFCSLAIRSEERRVVIA